MSPCRTFLFVVVAVVLACENVYAANVAGLNESKIIGGTVIDISDAPFIVRVVEDRGKLGTKSCGGSAINKFHVLTAAHCVELRAWVQNAGNEQLLSDSKETLHNARYLCPQHFSSDQFRTNDHGNLHAFAVPKICSGEPLTQEQMKNFSPLPKNVMRFKGAGESGTAGVLAPHPQSPSSAAGPATMQNIDVVPNPVIVNPNNPGKRAREEDDDELVKWLEPEEKTPRMDMVAASTPRRPLHATGARERTPQDAMRRITRKRLAQISGVQPLQMTPQTKVLLKTAQQYRKQALNIKYRFKKAQQHSKELKKRLSTNLLEKVGELLLSPTTRRILQGELRNLKRKPCGREWTLDEKLFALALYKRSPRAYRFLRRHVCLPGETTLKHILSKIQLEPGVCPTLLKGLQEATSKKKPIDKNCVVMFDEVYLNAGVYYNTKTHHVDGFEDYGPRGKTDRYADHALLFLVQGLHTKWTMPVAFYFVHKTCPSDMLRLLLLDVLKALFNIGLNVLATISDQGPTNRGAISLLKNVEIDDICYEAHGHRLVHIFDTPHVIKNVRNNLIKSNHEFDQKKEAEWSHLIEYFKLDESLCKMSKLTYKHLNPAGKAKMKVKLAFETLSETVAKSMKMIINVTERAKLSHCENTADLCQEVDLFADLTNGPSSSQSEKKKPTRAHVTDTSIQHEQWNSMIQKLWKYTYIRKDSGERHIPPCISGWIMNVRSFQWLWRRLKALGFKKMNLRHLNQDPLENLFGQIRQCCGSGSEPTCVDFIAGLKTCLVTQFSGNSNAKNCMDDDSFLLNDLRCLLLDTTSEADEQQPPSLIRGATSLPSEINDRLCKIKRQVPTFTCAVIVNEYLKNWECETCSKYLTTAEKSSDLSFTLSATHMSFQPHIAKYPSPAFINTFLKCQRLFLASWKGMLHHTEVVAEVADIFNNHEHWSWFGCSEHCKEITDKLCKIMASNLVVKQCQQINRQFESKRIKKTRQLATNNDPTTKTQVLSNKDQSLLYGIPITHQGTAERVNVPTTQTPQPQTVTTPLVNQAHPGLQPEPSNIAGQPRMMTPANRVPPLQTNVLGVTPIQKPAKMIQDIIANQEVDKLTIPQLKDIIKAQPGKHKITGLRKAELCALVYRIVTRSGPTYLVVYFGVTSRNQLSPQNKCKVKKVHSHPKYKNVGTNGNYRSTWDVSVLLVDKILPDLVTLAPASYKDIPTGKKLTIAGWGQTSKKGEGSTQLRSSIFTAMARSECDKILKGHTDPTDFCVVEDPKHAQCYGDSGGPVYDEDTETQYGIVSWGQCGSNGVGVVTDLTEPAINKFVRAFL